MKKIDDGSVDVILTDPPYLYLKNQKLDRTFDETAYFNEAKRVLKTDGFIVLFGRGTSFYRRNTILADLDFKFKEEIVWNKRRGTSPVIPLCRIHETISIYNKGNGKINPVKVPFWDRNKYDFRTILHSINRIKSGLGNYKELNDMLNYLEKKEKKYYQSKGKYNLTRSRNSNLNQQRSNTTLQGIMEGQKENSIIEQLADHYSRIHPTQKPVKLLQRLLALVSKEGDLILDTFSGSASTAIAAMNLGLNFICFEIDEEYYNASIKRIESIHPKLF
jgi:site-specific DNA-methyltransferase (adenine-specific)